MFYSQIILSKKGPLGKIWQAAHWGDKKLGRPAIFATDISSTVDELLHPVAPMALRVSGHLLLGVVRIYSRQVQYLADDCHAAVLKVQLAYSNKSTATTMKEPLTTTTTTATTTNVSHFGEYTDVEFAVPISQFQIPFDISDETSPEDWIPVAAYFEEESPVETTTMASPPTATERAQPEEEEWGEFNPSDDEEEEEEGKENRPETTKPSTSPRGKEEDSTVSSIEQPRAAGTDESTIQSDRAGRPSVTMMDSESKEGRPEQHSIPPTSDTEDFGNLNQDDSLFFHDEEEEEDHVKRHSINLDISRDESAQQQERAMVGFGDEGSTSTASQQEKEQPKRKQSQPPRRKRKRRKVVQDEDTIELSSEHIKQMLADTSDITLPIQHPANSSSSLISTKVTDHNVLLHHLALDELMARPTLADDGCMAKELLEFFDRTTRVIFGKPMGYDLSKTETKAKSPRQEEEEEGSDIEVARRSQEEEEEEEEQSLFQQAPDDQDMFSDNSHDENIFTEGPEETAVPVLDQEGDEFAPPPMDSPAASSSVSSSHRSLDSIFSLGATNDVDDEDLEGEEDEEGTTTTSTSKWHKNTIKVLEALRTSIRASADSEAPQLLSLSSMAKGVSRRTAAGVFFELLQLKTLNFIEINQADCQHYGDIVISEGPKFWQDPPTK